MKQIHLMPRRLRHPCSQVVDIGLTTNTHIDDTAINIGSRRVFIGSSVLSSELGGGGRPGRSLGFLEVTAARRRPRRRRGRECWG